jgi:ABC-type lipoprotein export system ATPase subunit
MRDRPDQPVVHQPVVREIEPTLSFERVTRRHSDGSHRIAILNGVSFTVRDGAFVGLFGTRRSGKSTLLRLAAGIELADGGTVRFGGRDLAKMSLVQREQLLRGPIAFLSTDDWRPMAGEPAVDHVALALASRGLAVARARDHARRALKRVAMLDRASDPVCSLSLSERMRVMLAKAIVREPRLLLIDEPALVPRLSEREEIAALIRSVAHELGSALIVASEELSALHGAAVLISIAGGEICSTEESRAEQARPGVVIELPKRTIPPREHFPL